jgi:hypothetical protein
LHDQLAALGQKEADSVAQLEILTQERDDATNKVAELSGEIAELTGREGELLNLRTEVTRLRQELRDSAASNAGTASTVKERPQIPEQTVSTPFFKLV